MRKLMPMLLILCFLLFSFHFNGYAQELNEMNEDSTEMYLSLEELIFSEDGIFFVSKVDLNLLPVASLSWHSSGLFLASFTRNPPCGHTIYCGRCGGCDPRNKCGCRCKCPPPGRWN